MEQLLDAYSAACAELAFAKTEIKQWELYKNSKARQSKWKQTPICKLSTKHINNILNYTFKTPLPKEWRNLLKTELIFRTIDFNKWYKQILQYENIVQIGRKCF